MNMLLVAIHKSDHSTRDQMSRRTVREDIVDATIRLRALHVAPECVLLRVI